MDLVAQAIKLENREWFMGAQRAAAKSHRGGLNPDLVILCFYLPSSDGLSVTRTRPTFALRRSRPITRSRLHPERGGYSAARA